MLSLSVLAFPALVAAASSGVVPTAPGPGDVFNEGTDCTFTWTPDTTGKWTDMSVSLMTGANLDMVKLKTILSSFDGTSSTATYSYPCPEVTPNSAIYFYQFENGDDTSTNTWTTRFAIADASGNTTPPPNETDGIPWGVGSLVGSGGSSNSSSSGSSGSSSTSGSVSSSSSGASTTSSSSSSATSSGRQTSTQVVTSSPSASPTSDGSGDTTGSAQGLKVAGAGALAGIAALGLLL